MQPLRMPIAMLTFSAALTLAAGAAHAAGACPAGGTVRMGVEPYDATAKLVPIYGHIAELISKKLDCKVEVFIATSYNAEIEAMRNDKLEFAEFGPLGYVLAHEVAKAEAVASFADKQRQARQLHRRHRHLARLGHHQAGGRRRQELRLRRSGVHLRPSVPGLLAGEERHRSRQGDQGLLRRLARGELRGAAQPQGAGRRD